MRLFLDITRIATRILRSSPTGIDRVEYAYATEILGDARGSDVVGVVTTPFFTGGLRRSLVADLMQRVARSWGLQKLPAEDAVYQQAKFWLSSPLNLIARESVKFQGATTLDLIRKEMTFPVTDLLRAKLRLKRWMGRTRKTHNHVYLHVSHTQLDQKSRFQWLGDNAVAATFFIHDTIPIDCPEYCSPGSYERHVERLRTVSEAGSLVIVNSAFTARSLHGNLSLLNMRIPEIEVNPLGIDQVFLARDALDAAQASIPYFVCVGTIEPRKNLSFLLLVWRRLVERLGTSAPRLVFIGRRGWENENVVDILDRSRFLAPYLAEISDLTDAGLASLIAGAQALVAPSLVEGFGLPVVESMAVGTPVLASDILAHREVGGDFIDYLDPIDGLGWVDAIEAFSAPGSAVRAARVERLAAYRPVEWRQHVGTTMALMARLAKHKG